MTSRLIKTQQKPLSKMTLKTILLFMSISLALGRPPFLLDREDLKHPPSRGKSHSPRVPSYMLHLYQMLMDENKDPLKPESQILQESDTVQSLPAKSCTVIDNHWTLMFDLHSISRGDELRLVELRVHLPPSKTASNITLEIHHSRNRHSSVLLESISTTMAISDNFSWKSFNITKMMEQYLHWENKDINQKDLQAMKIPHSAEIPASNVKYSEKPNGDYVPLQKVHSSQAIIVFFSKDRPLPKARPPSPGLVKRILASSKKMAFAGFQRVRRHHNNQESISTYGFPIPEEEEEEQDSLCRKVDMNVDFKEIGWDNWISHPKRYNAYRCEGTCHIPMKQTSKTTNYYYIKGLINLKEWERVECSSCVPVKIRPLSIMFNEGTDLVLRHLEDMIIEECGSL